jgi:hypothetical protein
MGDVHMPSSSESIGLLNARQAQTLRLVGREYEKFARDMEPTDTDYYIQHSFENPASHKLSPENGILVFPRRSTVYLSGIVGAQADFDHLTVQRDRDGLVLDDLFGSNNSVSILAGDSFSCGLTSPSSRPGLTVVISYEKQQQRVMLPVSDGVTYHARLDSNASQQDFWSIVADEAHLMLKQNGWVGHGTSTRFKFTSRITTRQGEYTVHLQRNQGDVQGHPNYGVTVTIPRQHPLPTDQITDLMKKSGCDDLYLDNHRVPLISRH